KSLAGDKTCTAKRGKPNICSASAAAGRIMADCKRQRFDSELKSSNMAIGFDARRWQHRHTSFCCEILRRTKRFSHEKRILINGHLYSARTFFIIMCDVIDSRAHGVASH